MREYANWIFENIKSNFCDIYTIFYRTCQELIKSTTVLPNDIYLLCLRDSSYDCSFKKKYRESDITLADFWGIQKVDETMYDNKGTSLVILNSDKGREL